MMLPGSSLQIKQKDSESRVERGRRWEWGEGMEFYCLTKVLGGGLFKSVQVVSRPHLLSGAEAKVRLRCGMLLASYPLLPVLGHLASPETSRLVPKGPQCSGEVQPAAP